MALCTATSTVKFLFVSFVFLDITSVFRKCGHVAVVGAGTSKYSRRHLSRKDIRSYLLSDKEEPFHLKGLFSTLVNQTVDLNQENSLSILLPALEQFENVMIEEAYRVRLTLQDHHERLTKLEVLLGERTQKATATLSRFLTTTQPTIDNLDVPFSDSGINASSAKPKPTIKTKVKPKSKKKPKPVKKWARRGDVQVIERYVKATTAKYKKPTTAKYKKPTTAKYKKPTTAKQTRKTTTMEATTAKQTKQTTTVELTTATQTRETTTMEAITSKQTRETSTMEATTSKQTRETTTVKDINANQTRETTNVNATTANETREITTVKDVNANQTGETTNVNATTANETRETTTVNATTANETREITTMDNKNVTVANQTGEDNLMNVSSTVFNNDTDTSLFVYTNGTEYVLENETLVFINESITVDVNSSGISHKSNLNINLTTNLTTEVPPEADFILDLKMKVRDLELFKGKSSEIQLKSEAKVKQLERSIVGLRGRFRKLRSKVSVQNMKISNLQGEQLQREQAPVPQNSQYATYFHDGYLKLDGRVDNLRDLVVRGRGEIRELKQVTEKHEQYIRELQSGSNAQEHQLRELMARLISVEQTVRNVYNSVDSHMSALRWEVQVMLDNVCSNNNLHC